MNNSQFRKLVVDTPARQDGKAEGRGGSSATPKRDGATPSALGSRMRASIPMTPRSVGLGGRNDFARQLAERNAGSQTEQQKTFKTSKVRGARLAEGYTDRTKTRFDEDEDEKAKRIKSLEEMMKLQQIDVATFIKLRDEIIGGDVSSVHLVKGLDFKLLERVRRGEDVLNGEKKEEAEDEAEEEDVEDEFEQLEDREVTAKTREDIKKRGEMAPPSLIPGQKRTRDMILAEMKAARLAAKEAAAPSLGNKFKKVGAPTIESRIERDGKGREVLITVDENGNVKRKVRKIVETPETKDHGLLMPDKAIAPLGMEVPAVPEPAVEEEEDIDIFDDAGDDYDPLAGLSGSDSDEEDKEDGEVDDKALTEKEDAVQKAETFAMPPPPKPVAPRNYFGDKPAAPSDTSGGSTAMSDPTILAALKKASTLNAIQPAQTAEEKAREEKRKRMLQQDDRDAQDMDMGFGSSRFEDEADVEDDGKIKLSAWGGKDDEDEEGGGKKEKRKRGPKKRKGDANNAADVLKVMERRKAAGS